ncbi:hypothetical protein GW915_03395 [bacterium]|nr:hypothetical protein [bacterium]
MRKLYVVLGSPQCADFDLEELRKEFKESEFSFEIVAHEDVEKCLKAATEADLFLAYSMGVFFVLKEMEHLRERRLKILLLSPFVVQERPLSLVARLLMGVNFIKQTLLTKGARKMAIDFVNSCTFNSDKWERREEAISSYSDVKKWDMAIDSKLKQQMSSSLQPISGRHQAMVLLGREDRAMNVQMQLQALERVLNFDIAYVPSAGHALLWTHSKQVAVAIQKLIGDRA